MQEQRDIRKLRRQMLLRVREKLYKAVLVCQRILSIKNIKNQKRGEREDEGKKMYDDDDRI